MNWQWEVMMIYLDLLCIAVIVIFIIDISGVVDTVKGWIWKWIVGKDKPYKGFQFKPFDCSLCMTHHICLLFALITGQFSLMVWMYICGLAMLSKVIRGALVMVSDILIKAINKIEDILL